MRRSAASAELTRQVEKSTLEAYQILDFAVWQSSRKMSACTTLISISSIPLSRRRSSLRHRALIFLLRRSTLALRLGVSGSWQRSEPYVFLRRYGRRSGQPSSSSLARRACVHVLPFSLVLFFFAVRRFVTGTWPLRRPRGDGNGGRFVRSPCLPWWCGLRLLYAVHQTLSPLVPVQRWSIELPATTVGPCEDTREDFGLSF